MRILFLTHRIPYPPNKGDKIRSYNILKYLIKHHEVYLGCLIDDKADVRFIGHIQSLVRKFIFDTIQPNIKKIDCLLGFTKFKPLSVSYFYSKKLQNKIDDLLDNFDIDVILCYSSPMAEFIFCSKHWNNKIKQSIRIMDLIDIDSYKWTQYAEKNQGWKGWLYRYEADHLAQYEHRIANTFDQLLVVSEQEKNFFPKGNGTANLSVMTNGVDLDFFTPRYDERQQIAEPAIVFTGVMDYWPNVEGVRWFVDSVFPLIKAAVPAVSFYVVGSRPTPEVRRLERVNGVTVTGFVDDIRCYLSAAAVCVVPLRIARGIQNKILEAMAMGKPVVSTTQALEGIQATPGEDIIQADSEDAFAAAVIDLLQNRERAELMGRRARSCVESNYSWEKNLKILEEIIQADKRILETRLEKAFA